MAKKKENNVALEQITAILEALIALAGEMGVDTEELLAPYLPEVDEDAEDESDDESEEEEDDVMAFVEELTDEEDVKAIAKELGIKTIKKTLAVIKKEILKKGEEEITEALTTLGYIGEEDSDEDAEEGAEIDLEAVEGALNEMSLKEIKEVADNAGIELKKGSKQPTYIKAILDAIESGEADPYEIFTEDQLATFIESDEDAEEEGEEEEGEEEEGYTAEEVQEILEDLDKSELVSVAEALEITVKKIDKETAIIKKIMAKEADEIVEALVELELVDLD